MRAVINKTDTAYLRRVQTAWSEFMETGKCDCPKVDRAISASWKRCREIEVIQDRPAAPIVADENVLVELQSANTGLCAAAREAGLALQPAFACARFLITVTDPYGVILEGFGGDYIRRLAAECNIVPGADWGEQASGTNAVGTALATRRPIQVHGDEHFCENFKRWSCAAAPILDASGKNLVGVFNVTGYQSDLDFHALSLAVSGAAQVSTILARDEAADRSRLFEFYLARSQDWQSDRVVLLDSARRIVHANSGGEAWLRERGLAFERGPSGRRDTFPQALLDELRGYLVLAPGGRGSLLVIPQSMSTAVQRSSVEQRRIPEVAPAHHIVGNSEPLHKALAKARKLGSGDFAVLLLGETGVGKEEFAHFIHACSPVRQGPFIAVNCAAISKELAASELFGYAEGAFTGARRGGRRGKFEEADGGTLFLDEIGELPLDVQPQLLRILQDSLVTRIGENRPRNVSVRIVSATNCDLKCASGDFRRDLYFRLSAATLVVPTLRERRDDIMLLAEYFIERLKCRYPQRDRQISAELRDLLLAYDWPGNVRELKGFIEAIWHLSDTDVLTPADIPEEHLSILTKRSSERVGNLQEIEKRSIAEAISASGGNMRKVARQLGIARSTLYEKVKKYGITSKPSTDA